MRILIRGGAVLTVGGMEEVRDGVDLLVEDGRIAAMGPALAPPPPDRVIDARDRLVIPGLVNAHLHSHNNYFRGWFDSVPLDLCVLHVWNVGSSPEALRLTPRQVYARALLGCAEMLRTGTTTAIDDVNLSPTLTEEHVEAVLRAYEDSGMRAVVAAHVFDIPYHRTVPFVADTLPPALRETLERAPVPDPRALADLMRTCARRWNARERRVGFGIGPSGPQRCSDALLRAMAEVAEAYDLPLYIHVLETRTQAAMGRVAYGKSLVERLRDLGVLSPRVTLGHVVWVTPADIEILAATGAMVCHNPVSNLKLGSGIAPVGRLLAAGVPVALGTDGVMSNDGLNMFETMKLAALLGKVRVPAPERWLGARQALRMATAGGARSARLEGVGAIAVGARADLVLLDLRRAAFAPRNDLLQQTVYAENGSSVDTVIVDGRVVVEGGRLTTVDEAAVAAEVTRDAADFHARNAGGRGRAAELEPYFRAMYERCWQLDVGTQAFGPEG
jgi:cytosine/adenosine deaminase-related metal-dependent hydrolase